jgi:ABC-type lipoprotein release transport system permease subunit
MERQIQYVGVLYDALYIIAGVIGLVLSWLLTLSRRKEIAVMRAMGTQPYRIVLNFAFEQAVLSAAGILLGGAIAVLTGCTLTPMLLILCGAFWGIWNLSTLVCLIAGLLKPSYASLTEPE